MEHFEKMDNYSGEVIAFSELSRIMIAWWDSTYFSTVVRTMPEPTSFG
jgi:hypothetical protein